MRYFVRFSYNGTDFHGSQTQPNGITVQEVMEKAFSIILRRPISLILAGRTDAGVHAKCMYAHVDISLEERAVLMADNYPYWRRLESLLPATIAVQDIIPVTEDAHARFSALSRTYEYHVSLVRDPFAQRQATLVAPGLDLEAMNQAAALLFGRHDFASFCRVHTDVKTTFCTISDAHWRTIDKDHCVFIITADRFLRNVVRAIVGTLFDVGRNKLSIDAFKQIIEARNRCAAGQSAPPEGLFLTDIQYPPSIFTP